ncbi:MAG: hypothetical protein PHN42_00185 [Bacilli bacterium]|nr:hypothetical protein [Bacilli bacterium]
MTKIDEIVNKTYSKYSNTLDLYKNIYNIITKTNGRYNNLNYDVLLKLVDENINILINMIDNNVYEIDEILYSSLEVVLSYFLSDQYINSGRLGSNSKKRMEKVSELINLKNRFTLISNDKKEYSNDEIINSTFLLKIDDFMKLYNGKNYEISKYKTEDELIEDLNSIAYSKSPIRKAYMCFVLENIKLQIEENILSSDLKYLLDRINFYIEANKNIGLPVIDRVSFMKIEMMIKIKEYEKSYVKS